MSQPPVLPPMKVGGRVHKYVSHCHDRIMKVLDIVDPANSPHTGDCLVVVDKWIAKHEKDLPMQNMSDQTRYV